MRIGMARILLLVVSMSLLATGCGSFRHRMKQHWCVVCVDIETEEESKVPPPPVPPEKMPGSQPGK